MDATRSANQVFFIYASPFFDDSMFFSRKGTEKYEKGKRKREKWKWKMKRKRGKGKGGRLNGRT